MYYCLNKDFILCSYKGLPYGLKCIKDGHITFMNDKKSYMLLYKCNGKNNFDELSLSDEQTNFIDCMVKEGIITAYDERHPLEGAIPSSIYTNNYRRSIHWSVTGRCNYKCRHCFQSAPEGLLGQPTFDEIMNMILQFKECGISDVSITGGEPLIRNDFFDIIDALTANGIHISTIYSNGALVNENLIKQFEERGIKPSFQISFDGVGWHDWLRGVKGAEEIAVNAIKLLEAHDFQVGCAIAIFRDNMNAVTKSIRLLESLGIKSVKLQRCMIQGEWHNQKEHFIEDDELLNYYMNLLDELIHADIHIQVQMEGVYLLDYSDEKKEYSVHNLYDLDMKPEFFDEAPSCGITFGNFFVGPNGAVVPCMNMCSAEIEKLFPNMFRTPLKKILTDSDYLKYSCTKAKEVVEHNEKCHGCEYVYHCGGGKCRANAIGDKKTDYYCIDEFECYIYKSGWADKLREKAEKVVAV